MGQGLSSIPDSLSLAKCDLARGSAFQPNHSYTATEWYQYPDQILFFVDVSRVDL